MNNKNQYSIPEVTPSTTALSIVLGYGEHSIWISCSGGHQRVWVGDLGALKNPRLEIQIEHT